MIEGLYRIYSSITSEEGKELEPFQNSTIIEPFSKEVCAALQASSSFVHYGALRIAQKITIPIVDNLEPQIRGVLASAGYTPLEQKDLSNIITLSGKRYATVFGSSTLIFPFEDLQATFCRGIMKTSDYPKISPYVCAPVGIAMTGVDKVTETAFSILKIPDFTPLNYIADLGNGMCNFVTGAVSSIADTGIMSSFPYPCLGSVFVDTSFDAAATMGWVEARAIAPPAP